jgi:hypothetical protein
MFFPHCTQDSHQQAPMLSAPRQQQCCCPSCLTQPCCPSDTCFAEVTPASETNPSPPAAALLSQLSDAATRLGQERCPGFSDILCLLLLRLFLNFLSSGLAPTDGTGAVPAPPAAALLSQLSDAATRPGLEAGLRLLVVLLRDRTTAGQDAHTRCRYDTTFAL